MKKRVLCIGLLLIVLCCVVSCSNAPRTIPSALSKANGFIEEWNRSDKRYMNYNYTATYSPEDKTYTVDMHPYTFSQTMMTRAIVLDSVEIIYETLKTECFANVRSVKIKINVYAYQGELRFIYDGRTLEFVG